MDLSCFFLSCVCYTFVRVCLFVPCGHLMGKGQPFGSRFWCLAVSLLLSHWYPLSSEVLDLCTFNYFQVISAHTFRLYMHFHPTVCHLLSTCNFKAISSPLSLILVVFYFF